MDLEIKEKQKLLLPEAIRQKNKNKKWKLLLKYIVQNTCGYDLMRCTIRLRKIK